MGYRVSAVTGLGGAVSVIVSTIEQAQKLIEEYREDGFSEIKVADLSGRPIDVGSENP